MRPEASPGADPQGAVDCLRGSFYHPSWSQRRFPSRETLARVPSVLEPHYVVAPYLAAVRLASGLADRLRK